MNVIVFGASGMVGQGVLREALLAPDVQKVLSVSRNPLAPGLRWPGAAPVGKLAELVEPNPLDLQAHASGLTGYDACFFCLGVSSFRMKEEQYRKITYGLTLAVANVLVRLNPGMTFIYVSGQGTDSTEKGKSMWARVKGRTENDLLALPFKAAYMFRPGGIEPLHGIRSRTAVYQAFSSILGPLLTLLRKTFPKSITTTEQLGRAMLTVTRSGYPKKILEPADITSL